MAMSGGRRGRGVMDADIGRVLVRRERIARRVAELGRDLADCYADTEPTLLAVLTGSLVFLADLMRHLPVMMRLELAWVSSYPARATTSQGVRLISPPADELAARLRGRHVLIVDDILDTGATLRLLRDLAADAGADSVRSCVLFRKDRPHCAGRPKADFVGFEIDDAFVVGCGLDFDGRYRNLPDLCVLRRHLTEEHH